MHMLHVTRLLRILYWIKIGTPAYKVPIISSNGSLGPKLKPRVEILHGKHDQFYSELEFFQHRFEKISSKISSNEPEILIENLKKVNSDQ